MEVGENHHGKRSRIGNGGIGPASSKIGHKELQQHQDEDEDDGERKITAGGGGKCVGGGESRIVPWHHPSSRIYRVSRTSGGKDRHSKVYTAKGIRDRRVRLSVSTAIQFYDLQDRLGYDQPSKAIEWLIKAASAAIDKLPSLDSSFTEPPKPHPAQGEPVELDAEAEAGYNIQNQQLTKSGCSSTSETSKGSVLSLSRSESRVKARERARERAAKDKEKGREEDNHLVASQHHQVNPSVTSQATFTELLGGGATNSAAVTAGPPSNSAAGCMQKQSWNLPSVAATADYFGQGSLFAQARKTTTHPHLSSVFSSQIPHLGNVSPMGTGMVPFNFSTAASPAAADHPEMQQFSFLQDNPIPATSVASGDYNLNFSFSISSGLVGVNRGTLQSNSPSQIPIHQHLHRLSSPIDGPNLPFFFGAAAPAAAAAAVTSAENQFPAGIDGQLQLWDGYRHSEMKEKGKN